MIKQSNPRCSFSQIVLLTAAAATAAVSSAQAQAGSPEDEGYTLVFGDEFDGSSLDRGAWCTRLAFGGGAPQQIDDASCRGPAGSGGTGDFLKDEQQRYRDTNRSGEALHVVDSGVLTLRATKTGYDSYASYESSLIRSKFEFKPTGSERYYVTTRVRLSSTRGSFSAFWLASGFGQDGVLSWPPEIDSLEAAMNEKDDKANMVRIGAYVSGAQTASGHEEYTKVGDKFDTKWNNFTAPQSLRDVWLEVASEWDANGVCTYIDGELAVCESYRWVDNAGSGANPAHVILNLAVGGEWAGRYGVDDSKPMEMGIDYVRVYKK